MVKILRTSATFGSPGTNASATLVMLELERVVRTVASAKKKSVSPIKDGRWVLVGLAFGVEPAATTRWLGCRRIALGMGKPGSEIQTAMAIVIFFRLVTSTALNIALVPAAYNRFRRQALGASAVALAELFRAVR